MISEWVQINKFDQNDIYQFKYQNLNIKKMGSALYSDFQLGIIHTETEKAYFATIFLN